MPTVKWVFRRCLLQIVVDRLDHGGREFLGRQAVAAADDFDGGALGFVQGVDDVEVKRFAGGAGFFAAVEDGDLLYCGRKSCSEMLDRERAIEADFEEADFFAAGGESLDGFVGGFGAGAHHDDDALGVGSADVIEKMIGAADDLGELVHGGLDFVGGGVVDGIDGLAHLEEDVGILRGAAKNGMIGRESALAMLEDAIHIDHGAEIVVVEDFDLVDLVRGAEAVEEMEEGDAGFERGGMGDEGEVHRLLHGIRGEHGVAGGAAEHDIAVVAEDGERVRGDGAGGDVEGGGRQLAGDLIHVGDHEQQALRSGEGGGQGSGLQGAVDGAGGAAFALHFGDLRDRAPDVELALGGPLIGPLAHVGRRSDGIDGDDFIDAISDAGNRFVAIHGLEFAHRESPLSSAGGGRKRPGRNCAHDHPGAARRPAVVFQYAG